MSAGGIISGVVALELKYSVFHDIKTQQTVIAVSAILIFCQED